MERLAPSHFQSINGTAVSVAPRWVGMPPAVSYTQTPMFLILGVALTLLAVVFALSVRRWRHGPTRTRLAELVASGVALAVVVSVMGYGVYIDYVRANTWTFSYSIRIQGTAFPDAVIVPSVADESLLAGLTLVTGIANWSFVDTTHGRGLYVAFDGNTTLSTYISRFPPPVPLPDASLTMMNGTGPWQGLWVWHRGSAALSVNFYENYRFSWPDEIQPGWQTIQMTPVPAAN